MEDSFRVRVDRTFGSLEASSSTKSTLSSLWCLTDEEIQRNEWIRDKHDDDDDDLPLKNPKPYPSFLDNLLQNPKQLPADSSFSTSHQDLESDIQDLDDQDEDDSEDENPRLSKPENDANAEDWDIRSSMGMDCTLDNEEEEDGYDKVALGMEESAERFYMKDVNDYEVEIDSNIELPSSFTQVLRDPRANHVAAKLRLKEDDELAVKLGDKDQSSGSQVPDYICNPSKYTHYTFDSLDDVDEDSNRKACMDLFNLLKRSNETAMETQDEPPTSIVFTPKKKPGDGLVKKRKADAKKAVPLSIAEATVMEEDEPEMATNKISSLQKGSRRYRTKSSDAAANADEEPM